MEQTPVCCSLIGWDLEPVHRQREARGDDTQDLASAKGVDRVAVRIDELTTAGRDRSEFEALLARQRRAFLAEQSPTAEERIARITRLVYVVASRARDLVAALRADYGNRSDTQSMATDVLSTMSALKHTRRHVRAWMKPERQPLGFALSAMGARATIIRQPLGVVGIIAPWNFPVTLSLQPLGQALAAGNRAMVKLSELAPATAEVLRGAVADEFDPSEVAVVTGGPDVAEEFSRLRFDHLFFTGATSIGRRVMMAASENVVPVTLELGGKSPVVMAPDADVERTAAVMMFGKTLNAGQFCVAPDYLFVPEGSEAAFMAASQRAVERMFPSILDNDDYTSIINDRHHRRLMGYLADAQARGAEVVTLGSPDEDFANQDHHKIPPTLLFGVDDSMEVARDEVFGPLLPVLPYRRIEDVIEHVNARPRPLAAYYFGGDTTARRRFLEETVSGGVTVNDIMLHVALEDLPFGGVGESGMGTYHGRAGFETFSHAKPVVEAPRLQPTRFLGPPYPRMVRRVLPWLADREARAAARASRRTVRRESS